jgi:hypothetical protein
MQVRLGNITVWLQTSDLLRITGSFAGALSPYLSLLTTVPAGTTITEWLRPEAAQNVCSFDRYPVCYSTSLLRPLPPQYFLVLPGHVLILSSSPETAPVW